MIEHVSRAHFIRAIPKLFRGTHDREPNVHMSKVTRIRLDADRPFAVYADRDEVARTPAVVTALTRAVNVRMPG
jgi:diacylglycerol kinase family enzyme